MDSFLLYPWRSALINLMLHFLLARSFWSKQAIAGKLEFKIYALGLYIAIIIGIISVLTMPVIIISR